MEKNIQIIKTEKSWIESNAIEQLHQIAQLKGIIKAIGLPDLHVGKTPVGASYITKDVVYPHIVGNDIGCGMAFFATGLKRNKFKVEKIKNKLEKIDGIENVDISIYTRAIDLPFKEKLGTIGAGNHFAEIQEIAQIYDPEGMDEIGIDKEHVYLLVHSGSRNYGEFVLRKYIEEYHCQNGLSTDSQAFALYWEDHNKALEYAKLNRELIAHRIVDIISGKANQKLLDSVHNGIFKKEIQGEVHYIHRKGASPSDAGYVVVAGSRGSKSYIVKPMDNLVEYGFSISHGAGRKWSRFGCKEKLENLYSKKAIRHHELVSNLIYRDKNVVYEEAPEAYKNIERVIEDMLEAKMIQLIASLNPLLTYKS
ncbi:release factor H-coupled RctB family protein [Anaerosolibacter carboniphilus]|uniref:3'-phosphate/5'-hydroxy nucleic acid ligase n=1 Tax=Anaerosolibacter carboniphilus TaxID=1417629 RepID=A0A841KUJ0_9FIRM|nr:RNA ligase RtcB family protein [Anaerosolibacter carboniphilus]MBB6217374.1 release factor H-coupled RctB family protein [Anaerosolibacter carboniphilus]